MNVFRQSVFLPFQTCPGPGLDEEKRAEEVHAVLLRIDLHVGHIVDIVVTESKDHVRLKEETGLLEILEHRTDPQRSPVLKADSLAYRILLPEKFVGERSGDGYLVWIAYA